MCAPHPRPACVPAWRGSAGHAAAARAAGRLATQKHTKTRFAQVWTFVLTDAAFRVTAGVPGGPPPADVRCPGRVKLVCVDARVVAKPPP